MRPASATWVLDGMELNGTDQLPDAYEAPRGISIIVTLPDADRGRAVFDGLAAGGSITLPFQSTFWTSGFGVLVDPFGISWEVNTDRAPT